MLTLIQIGMVGQEPVLFAKSIKENIAYGCHRPISDEEIHEAAKQVRCIVLIIDSQRKTIRQMHIISF